MNNTDSAVCWSGLPKDWRLLPIKYGFDVTGSGTTPPTGQEEYFGGLTPWVTTSELRENIITATEKTLSELALNEFSSLKIYPPDTVLFAMYGATIGRLGILGVPACVNQAVFAMSQPTFFDPRFVFYVLQASRDYLLSLASGGGQPNLNAAKIKDHQIPCPPLPEQRAIAAYLDRETARLDALTAALERLLGLLVEKRQALIARAVTRGLNPAAPLRASGVAWLGEIPAHWEVTRLKTVCESLQTGPFGTQLHAEDYVEDGTPVINPAHLIDNKIVPDPKVSVNDWMAEYLAAHKLEIGDIVFARRGEVGRCGLVTEKEAGWLCGTGSLRARPHKETIHSEYLIWLITNSFASTWLSLMAVGTTMKNLNTEIIGELTIPLPPLAEQNQIANFIHQNTQRLDALQIALNSLKKLLDERRTALITAAVSGQIEVTR